MVSVMVVVLAHGALGIWDEVIFLSVAFIFVVMMAVSWVRSRNMEVDFDDTNPVNTSQRNGETSDEVSSDRFELR